MQASAQKVAAPLVVDASVLISGRLCSVVAKRLLNGNRVVVVNAEKALISGSRESILKQWEESLEITSITNPIHGPYHPRKPERILQRMVRGMLPMQKAKGATALKRLRVYDGVPEEFAKSKMTTFDEARGTKPLAFYTTVGDVAKLIGWKGA